jgi:NDP-sugar pyrophosphorylase family protein
MSRKKENEIVAFKDVKAVIIGETFTSLLDPLTLDTPCLLLPICGIPIIELILNSLSSIKEILICINKHKKLLEKYLHTYHPKLKYKIIYNENFKNVDDCLRQINKQDNNITSDFILIRGLSIINSDFEELYNVHLQNKKNDKNCIITTLMKKFKTTNEIKTTYDENILIYNDINKQIYQYEPTYGKKNIEIFKKMDLKGNIDINYIVRSDLIETGVDICTPKFIEQLSGVGKFCLQSVRDTIGSIISDEIYDDTFYLHELSEDDYCGLIRNIESYLKVNFEILNRWGYPIVIDNIDMSNKLKINLKQIRFSLYSDKDSNSENFRKADLFSQVVILNKENIVGKESKLKECILCKDIKIGEKCELYNCIILEGTKIENNVIIKNSIIGKKCVIKSGTKVISSVLGSNVVLDKDSIKKRIFVDELNQLHDIDKDTFLNDLEEYEKICLSKNSRYGFYITDLDTDKDEIQIKDDNEFYSDEEIIQEEETFEEGVEHIISTGQNKNKEPEELVNEIWTLRNYKNPIPTPEETLQICLTNILRQFLNGKKFVKNINNVKGLIELFKNWKPLFDKFVIDDFVELKLISVLEQICMEVEEIKNYFYVLLQILNGQCKLIKDQTIFDWNENEESSYETTEGTKNIPHDVNKKNKKDMKKYIEDLKENEEDDEEEEEEEDDDKN